MVAVTENEAVFPAEKVALTGWVPITGATLSDASLELTEMVVPLRVSFTITAYRPASVGATGFKVSVLAVCPARSTPSFRHW